MSNSMTYLAPGLLVTLEGERQSIHFTQFAGRLRRALPWRLALVDALNRGYQGNLADLAAELAERFNLDTGAQTIMRFLQHLRTSGFLTENQPPVHFSDEVEGKTGTIGPHLVTFNTPVSLVCQQGHYLWFNHQGDTLLKLTLPEVLAAAMFAEPVTLESARAAYLAQDNADGLDAAQFDALVSRMAGAQLLHPAIVRPDVKQTPLIGIVDGEKLQRLVDAKVAAHDERIANSGKDLVSVIPVNANKGTAPAALGLLMAYAMEYDGGRLGDKFDFVPMFFTDDARIAARASTPGVFMFSNYMWTLEDNLRISALVKAINPANITVHGGPDSPSYEKDCERFFADNPHVDVIVRGEGELTFAELLDALDLANLQDLSVLEHVPGLSYRTADGVRRTANRERIADLDSIPSPYLIGLMDEFGAVRAAAVIETNRGCPYGCTFCDWGSATLSKVRRFDLDRVLKELEWSALNTIEGASIADANFGMLERDVAIAEKIASLKRTHGYPRTVAVNYAKNQVKHLLQIIRILADAQILAEGVVSLQTTDESTLKVIERSNIKLNRYDEIAVQFRQAKLPLAVDIMMGLPGSTPQAFKSDLQKCTDRDLRVRANPTQLLPNSPMNEPSYRLKHGIVARPGELVKEAASYTRKEWEDMDRLRIAYYLFDNYGLLRYVARFVRRETGMGEIEFYDRVRSEALSHPEQWPIIASAVNTLEGYMAPQGSWGLFIAETRRYIVDYLGLPDDSALRTALSVQHAHMPTPGRVFPDTIALEHDFISWQEALLACREDGHREDWHKHVPRLSEYGPATLVIDDPNEICVRDVGVHKYLLDFGLRSWEFDSPLARPRLGAVSNLLLANAS